MTPGTTGGAQREIRRHRPYQQQQSKDKHNPLPSERTQPTLRDKPTDQKKNRSGKKPLDLVHEGMHDAVIAMSPLRGTKSDSGSEDREKTIPMDQLSETVGRKSDSESHKALAVLRQPKSPPVRPKEKTPQNTTQGIPHTHTHSSAQQQVIPDPVARPRQREATGRSSRKSQSGHHKRKSKPIVETSLTGQGKTRLILVELRISGLTHTHLPGQHRISRSQNRGDQKSHRRRPTQQPPPDESTHQNRERHCKTQQPPRTAPRPPTEGPIERKTSPHKRHNSTDLGEMLDSSPGRDRIKIRQHIHRKQKDPKPQNKKNHRHRKRPPRHQRRQDSDPQRPQAKKPIPQIRTRQLHAHPTPVHKKTTSDPTVPIDSKSAPHHPVPGQPPHTPKPTTRHHAPSPPAAPCLRPASLDRH